MSSEWYINNVNYFSVISVSAGHQFAVNRWNPGYAGGNVKSGVAGGQSKSSVSGSGGASEQAAGVTSSGHQASQASSGGIIFVCFVMFTTAQLLTDHSQLCTTSTL